MADDDEGGGRERLAAPEFWFLQLSSPLRPNPPLSCSCSKLLFSPILPLSTVFVESLVQVVLLGLWYWLSPEYEERQEEVEERDTFDDEKEACTVVFARGLDVVEEEVKWLFLGRFCDKEWLSGPWLAPTEDTELCVDPGEWRTPRALLPRWPDPRYTDPNSHACLAQKKTRKSVCKYVTSYIIHTVWLATYVRNPYQWINDFQILNEVMTNSFATLI